ncbi:hypothetical protein [Streptomyces sp. KL116D]|uniref:hypothetical protein n=1 Tax=Streptomyces sp. KL116D TaxID=3045152 RepID=UPI003558583A
MIRIVLTGQQGARLHPVDGRRPDARGRRAVIVGIGQLYRQVSAFDAITVTIGHVEDVGRFNIVPGEVTLWGHHPVRGGAGHE